MSLLRAVAGVERHFGGYKKDRAGVYQTLLPSGAPAPDECELDDSAIPIFDQGSFGSCTANGGAFQAAWLKWRAQKQVFVGARFGLYNLTHVVEGTPLDEDSGAMPADMVRALETYGIGDESLFPYVAENFGVMPPQAYLDAAKQHQALLALRCASVETVMQSIADGFPVGFGFQVSESFESDQVAKSGIVPMPEPGEKQVGGHYVVATGFKRSMTALGVTGFMKVRNSWSADWGQGGYCWMPLDFWRQGIAADNWTVRREGL